MSGQFEAPEQAQDEDIFEYVERLRLMFRGRAIEEFITNTRQLAVLRKMGVKDASELPLAIEKLRIAERPKLSHKSIDELNAVCEAADIMFSAERTRLIRKSAYVLGWDYYQEEFDPTEITHPFLHAILQGWLDAAGFEHVERIAELARRIEALHAKQECQTLSAD